MSASDPIERYVRELRRELRGRRGARRRIVAEVRTHLLEAADAERASGADEHKAAEQALARFGSARDTARRFDGLASRRRTLLRRALAPSLAVIALSTLASATVWASRPGTRVPHVRHVLPTHKQAVRHPRESRLR